MELVDTSEEFSTMSGWQKFNHFVEFHVHELFKRNAPVGEGLEHSLSRLSRCCGGRFVLRYVENEIEVSDALYSTRFGLPFSSHTDAVVFSGKKSVKNWRTAYGRYILCRV